MANVLRFQNSIKLVELASDPGSPENGLMWFNTTDGAFRFYDGSNTLSLDSALSEHLDDTTDAHDGSAISAVDNFTNSNGTDVQTVLENLDTAIGDLTFVPSNYANPGTDVVAAHLQAIDTALSSAGGTDFSDADFRISDNGDSSKKIAFEASGITTSTVRTVTMPDANVDLGDLATSLQAAAVVADNALVKGDGGARGMQATGISVDDSNNVTGVNDMTVTGNLTVNGTTTTLDTTNLDVQDKNITVNNGGNDASSEGAGLTIERTGTDGSLIYADASASKFKIGAVGGEIDVADVSSTQTLTNKTLDADNNTISNLSDDEISSLSRSKLGAGSNNHVLINSGAGAMSSEAALAASRGGLGADASAFDGVVKASSGTFSAASLVNADVDAAAAIELSKLEALTASRALVSDGSGEVAVSAVTDTELGYLDGVTSSIQTQLGTKLENVSEDGSPSLGGNLDAGSNVVIASGGLKLGNSASEFYEHDYEELDLTDNTTAVASDFTYAAASFEGCIIEYKIKEATANKVRCGQLFIANNASAVSIVDQSTETADPGVSWSAAVNATNIEISYTTTSTGNTRAMKAIVKRLKA